MFTRLFEWLTDLFPKSEKSTESILDAFEDASEELRDFVKDIKKAIDNDKKQFLVEVTVGEDTKMRPLKAGMETALVTAMATSNPECTDWTVKSYYHRGK